MRYSSIVTVFLLWSFASPVFADVELLTAPANIKNTGIANFVENNNGVSIIEYSGDYNRSDSAGAFNLSARAQVANQFYEHNTDNFDFLVVFSAFDFDREGATALHTPVANSVQGIGLPIFDNKPLFGSENKLQGFVDMGPLSQYDESPLGSSEQLDITASADVMSHEILHQWAVHFPIETDLTDGQGHWSFYVDSDASLMYGHDWRDNTDGTFKAIAARKKFSDLDLYLMGLIDASEVAETFLIEPASLEYDPDELPAQGVTVAGTKRTVSIADIVNREGARIPSSEDSQKSFRVGFIYLVDSSEAVPQIAISKIQQISKTFVERFAILTDGQATVSVNPPPIISTIIGESETALTQAETREGSDVALALDWLKAQQDADGAWRDKDQTAVRDTLEVANLIAEIEPGYSGLNQATLWLEGLDSSNNDAMLRLLSEGIIEQSSFEPSSLVQADVDGLGLSRDFEGSAQDTSLAICTSIDNEIDGLSSYLFGLQNANGGWGSYDGAGSSVLQTAQILSNISCLNARNAEIELAINFLVNSQTELGSFGDTSNAIYGTALVFNALYELQAIDRIDSDSAIQFISQAQQLNGSWGGSIQNTVQAVRALNRNGQPNLSISGFSTPKDVLYPSEFVPVDITVENNGSDTVAETTLELLQSVDGGRVQVEQLPVPSLPPFSQAQLSTYWLTPSKSGAQQLVAVADSLDQIAENNENDNEAELDLVIQAPPTLPDLILSKGDTSISPNQISVLPANLQVATLIRNIGLTAVENAVLQIWRGDVGSGELVYQSTVSIEGQSQQLVSVPISITSDGASELTLIIDANNEITEANEANNQIKAEWNLRQTVDLEVVSIIPGIPVTSITAGLDVPLAINIRNNGTSNSPVFELELTAQGPQETTVVQNSSFELEAGEVRTINSSWRAVENGPFSLIALVDASDQVAETDESNNQQSLVIDPELVAGTNLVINFSELDLDPNPVNEGDSVGIELTVRNTGRSLATSSTVAIYDGNPGDDGTLLLETPIEEIAGGSSVVLDLTTPPIEGGRDRFLYAWVDYNDAVIETNDDDNVAFKHLAVTSLPDLAISTDSIVSDPPFPVLGQVAIFNVEVVNAGMQAAGAVRVDVFSGDAGSSQLLSTQSVNLAGNSSANIQVEHTFESSGENLIRVELDPENVLLEGREDNNSAERIFQIQSAEFYLSDRFLSPDGNGIKDTVEYVYQLMEPSEVVVKIIDQYGREVRSLRGADGSHQSGSVIWDGRNELGGLVSDGDYSLSVVTDSEQVLGARTVTIDTNRSSLAEAIESEFLLRRNLSCRIGEVAQIYDDASMQEVPDTQNILYDHDGQYVFFTTYFEPIANDSGGVDTVGGNVRYPSGVYRAFSDGSNVRQIASLDQFVDPDSTQVNRQSITNWDVSIDGENLVFGIRDGGTGEQRIWSINVDVGEPIKIVDLAPFGPQIFDLKLLANGNIMYVLNSSSGVENTKVFVSENVADANQREISFAADVIDSLRKLTAVELNSSRTHGVLLFHRKGFVGQGIVNIHDTLGLPFEHSAILVDLFGEESKLVSGAANDFAWSPQGDRFAVGSASEGVVKIMDREGDLIHSFAPAEPQLSQYSPDEADVLYSFYRGFSPHTSFEDFFNSFVGQFHEFTWSPDGRELAFYVEDHVASIAVSDGCSDFSSFSKTGATPNPAILAISNLIAPPVLSQINGIFGCLEPPENIREMIRRYDPQDGVYIFDGVTEEVSQVAQGEVVNGSMVDGVFFSPTRTAEQIATGVHQVGVTLSESAFPITRSELPLISWSGTRWLADSLRGGDFIATRSKRTMRWLSAGRELLISGGDENFEIESAAGLQEVANQTVLLDVNNPRNGTRYIFEEVDLDALESIFGRRSIYPDQRGRTLTYVSSDDFDACAGDNFSVGYRQVRSLLNMATDLRVSRASQSETFELSGTAADKHFASYRLEFATEADSPQWQSLVPPSSTMIIDDLFTTWVPPSLGNFLVRLTVQDFAGNSRQKIVKLNNQKLSDISSVAQSSRFVSPNGDGAQDGVTFDFRIVNPVNLTVQVFNSEEEIVRTITDSFDLVGSQQSISWDGRDDVGALVPDGQYRVVFDGRSFIVLIDTTPPLIQDKTLPYFKPPPNSPPRTSPRRVCRFSPGVLIENVALSCGVFSDAEVVAEINEGNLQVARLERSQDGGATWSLLNEVGPRASDVVTIRALEEVFDLVRSEYRVFVEDAAGNQSLLSLNTQEKKDKAHITKLRGGSTQLITPALFGYSSNDVFGTSNTPLTKIRIAAEEPLEIWLEHSAIAPILGAELLYRTLNSGQEFSGVAVTLQETSEGDEFLVVLDESLLADFPASTEFKIRLFTSDNEQIDTNAIEGNSRIWELEADLFEIPAGFVETSFSGDELSRIELVVRSVGDFDPVYSINGGVISTDFSPEISSGHYQFDLSEQNFVPLRNECGFEYELIARGYIEPFVAQRDGLPAFVESVERQKADCGDIELGIIQPVYGSSCDAIPTKKLGVEVALGDELAELTLLTLALNSRNISIGTEISPEDILETINLPEPGAGYSFEIDTSLLTHSERQNFLFELVLATGEKRRLAFDAPISHFAPEVNVEVPQTGDLVCPVLLENVEGEQVSGLLVEGEVSSEAFRFDRIVHNAGKITDDLPSVGAFAAELSPSADRAPDYLDVSSGETVPIADRIYPPVQGGFSAQGILGVAENPEHGPNRIVLEARNWSGARVCEVRDVEVDAKIEINSATWGGFQLATNRLGSVKNVISPNADGVADALQLNVDINESVTAEISVYSDDSDRELVTIPIRDQRLIANGEHTLAWSGENEAGELLPDGDYSVEATLRDSCGNKFTEAIDITIDTSPPVISILSPQFGEPLPLEVIVTADIGDEHPGLYEVVLVGPGTTEELLATGNSFSTRTLANWNTLGLTGAWQVRVKAEDAVGNTSEELINLELPDRANLISSLQVANQYFSPTNDGKLDDQIVRVGFDTDLIASVDIIKSDGNVVARLAENQNFATGIQTFVWDGLDDAGRVAPDDEYRVRITASAMGVQQTELAAFVLDNTPPLLSVENRIDDFLELGSSRQINGSVSDQNFQGYRIGIRSIDGLGAPVAQNFDQLVDSSIAVTGNLAEIPAELFEEEGEYELEFRVSDLAENTSIETLNLVIDSVPPEVELYSPAEDDVFGPRGSPLGISGRVNDRFLKEYVLTLVNPNDSAQNIELFTGEMSIDGDITQFDIASVADGSYDLVLTAKDLSGNSASATRAIVLDSTPPQVSIITPSEAAFLTEPMAVVGNINDQNLQQYSLSIAPGTQPAETEFDTLITSSSRVDSASIYEFTSLPPDGTYALRLEARDNAGNTSTAIHTFTVDTAPPLAPSGLQATPVSSDVELVWIANPESDVAGYFVYRDGELLNEEPQASLSFLDENIDDGEYSYVITAVDHAGLISEFSSEVTVEVDTTPPVVRILRPADGQSVNLLVDIIGTAYSDSDFDSYIFSVGTNEENMQVISESNVPILNDLLLQWNTLGLTDDTPYLLRLQAKDATGNQATDTVAVVIDNQAPPAPFDLAATLENQTVTLDWGYELPISDIAGFLIFRNGDLLNSDEVLVGDLSSIAIAELQYIDQALPDGTYIYEVNAVDAANNVSPPSNAAEVVVESGAPAAVITNLEEGQGIMDSLELIAESEANDVASVEFQYRALSESTWMSIAVDSNLPFEIQWDSSALAFGDYALRAVAADQLGNTDSAPAEITVEKRDITPPAIVSGLQIQVDANEGVLVWIENEEPDLGGYIVYRSACASCADEAFVALNQSPITEPTYTDNVLNDGVFLYRVAAVDLSGNQGEASDLVTGVFARTLLLEREFLVTNQESQALIGLSPDNLQFDQVLVARTALNSGVNTAYAQETPNSQSTQLALDFDIQGLFEFSFTAASGPQDYIADTVSHSVVVAGDPTSPSGVMATVQADTTDVALIWDPRPLSEDIAGYQVDRNGEIIGEEILISDATAAASRGTNIASILPQNNSTLPWNTGTRAPEVTFSQTWQDLRRVRRVEFDWQANFYAAQALDIFAFIDDRYVQVAAYTRPGDRPSSYVVEFSTPIPTTSIQVQTRAWDNAFLSGRLDEMRVFADEMVPSVTFTETVADGEYQYRVRSIDRYGGISDFSEIVGLTAGDVTAPNAPVLIATALASDAQLSWISVEDAATYRIYRNDQQIADVTDTAFSDLGLMNGVYAFYVTAVDLAGNESAASNQEMLTIDTPLLPAPTELSAVENLVDQRVELSWSYPAEPNAAMFRVYRSLGNVFSAIAETSDTVYNDGDVVMSFDYQYYVVALDEFGNESPSSNTVIANLIDSEAPPAPVIYAPTDSSTSITVEHETSTVAGVAEPGSEVFLIQNGLIEPTPVSASSASQIQDLVPDGEARFPRNLIDSNGILFTGWSYSSTSSTRFYRHENGLQQELALPLAVTQQNITQIEEYQPNKLRLIGRGRIFEFDIETTIATELTVNTGPDFQPEEIFNFSAADNILIATARDTNFNRNLYLFDLNDQSAVELTNLRHFVVAKNLGLVAIAHPEGDNVRLELLDTDQNQQSSVTLVGQNESTLFDQDAHWAPNGENLLVRLANDAQSSIGIVNRASSQVSEVYLENKNLIDFVWNGNQEIVVLVEDLASGNTELYRYSLATNEFAIIPGGELLTKSSASLFGISKQQEIFVQQNLSQRTVVSLVPTGQFVFDDVALESGDNLFSALSLDAGNNISSPAQTISVVRNQAALADFSVRIDTNPQFGVVGQTMSIALIVENLGDTRTETSELVARILQPDNTFIELEQTLIGSIPPGEQVRIELPWSPAVVGDYTITASIDDADRFAEVSESNNHAIVQINVLADALPTLSLATNGESDGQLSLTLSDSIDNDLTVFNPGQTFDGRLILRAIDAQDGTSSNLFDRAVLDLGYDESLVETVSTEAGTLLPGEYELRAELYDAQGAQIANTSSALNIQSDIQADVSLQTNQFRYTQGQDVTHIIDAINSSQSELLQNGVLRLDVRDDQGVVAFSSELTLQTLLPSESVSQQIVWPMNLTPPGTYFTRVALLAGNLQLAESTTQILIEPGSAELVGALALSSRQIPVESNLLINAEIRNTGVLDLADLIIDLRLLSADDEVSLQSFPILELGASEQELISTEFSLAGLVPAAYRALLEVRSGETGDRIVLDSAAFEVFESEPPELVILTPAADQVVNSFRASSLIQAQDEFGVRSVSAQIDSGAAVNLFSSPANGGLYQLSLASLEEGNHQITALAIDVNDNESNPVSRSFVVDNTPPDINILNIEDSQVFETSVVPLVEISDLNLVNSSTRVNGIEVTSGTVISEPGNYRLVVDAVDAAENRSQLVRRFTIGTDTQPPEPELAASDDTLELNRGVWGTIDLLANDLFEERADLVVTISSQPQNGSLVEAGNGVYNYFPALRFVGSDSFSYEIFDTVNQLRATAQVFIHVSPVASCSMVPDHITEQLGEVELPGWARAANDNQLMPQYQVEILSVSDTSAFVDTGVPEINYPACDLVYQPRAGVRSTVEVTYQVVDAATSGDEYRSPERVFVITIDSGTDPAKVVIPAILFLLQEELEEPEQEEQP